MGRLGSAGFGFMLLCVSMLPSSPAIASCPGDEELRESTSTCYYPEGVEPGSACTSTNKDDCISQTCSGNDCAQSAVNGWCAQGFDCGSSSNCWYYTAGNSDPYAMSVI
jgi:hypothetical protein